MPRRAFAPVILVAALATPAAAQSTLQRLEAVAVTMNGMMNAALMAEIPALEGNLPDPAWDRALRDAYTCMYASYVAEVGEAPVAAMVMEMEARLPTLSADQALTGGGVDLPDGISEARATEIVTECQVVDAFMARMAESGAIEIMMQQQ